MQKLSQIPERDAAPDVAALYDDIRRVTRVPLVNLIYRHMATLPGVLPWVWSLIRPQIVAGAIESAVDRMLSACTLPAVAAFGPASLRAAGLDDARLALVMRVLAAYNRGNTLNVVSLTAVRLALDVGVPLRSAQPPSSVPETLLPLIPPIRRPEELDPDTAARLAAIARLHGGDGVLPSLYLHLANWPGFLALACDRLAPLLRDGTIQRSRDEVGRLVDHEARALVPLLTTDVPAPTEHVPALRDVLDTFTRRLIPEMIPVGFALSRAMPDDKSGVPG